MVRNNSSVGVLLGIIIGVAIILTAVLIRHVYNTAMLEKIITRLQADSRVAEVLVTNVAYDEAAKKIKTTIKFLEYTTENKTLPARYFTFSGSLIQFQSLVVRFDDLLVKRGDPARGRSVYLFWKAFMLDGSNTEERIITPLEGIPSGYKVDHVDNRYQRKFWERFWVYALDTRKSKRMGIKSAQIEAPGTMFVPGMLYILKIEHDGGIRIDSSPLPEIVKGETVLKN